jgi:type II secretory pathway component PulF
MEVFQNGKFSNGGPVYQVGTKNADGTYVTVVFDLMTKEQAEAKLESMGVKKPVEEKPVAKKKAPAKKKSASKK